MKLRHLILLPVFWLVLTEKITPERVLVGLLAVGAVWVLNAQHVKLKRLSARRLGAGALFRRLGCDVRMAARLIKEIIVANLHVAAIVLRPKLALAPSVVTVSTPLREEGDRVLLANAITLTPGTLTLLLEGNTLTVHCLDEQSAGNLNNMAIEKMLLEREAIT